MKVSDDILNPPRKNVKQGIDIPVQGEPVMKSAGPIEPSPLSSNNPLPSELQSPAPKYDTLTDINKYMYGDDIKKLEAEEKDAEKRKRSHAIISSIGGGLSALSNLYFTTQGAPNVQQADYAGRFVKEYNDAKAKRERLKEQWKARMADAVRGDLLSRKRSEEIKAQQDREDGIRANALKRDDARYAGEKEYRRERDTESDRRYDQQYDLSVKQGESARQNAAEGIQLKKDQLSTQDKKIREARLYQFKKMQGDEIPFVLDGKTYVVGSKALSANVGNIVAGILDDVRVSDKFKDKSDKELANDHDWADINRSLNTARSDVKKLAESMKKYAKYSPSAIAAFRSLSDYYTKGKQEIGNDVDSSSLGLGWDNEGDSLDLNWDK